MKRIGYGQVEPNHLSAQRNGKIYAQLPADSALTLIENGMFLKYDYAAGVANIDGEVAIDGEWLLVYNEVKTYDARESYKDFALKAENAHDGVLVPRLFKTDIGDIFTTNCIGAYGAANAATNINDTLTFGTNEDVGDYLIINGGYLTPSATKAANGGMTWKIVKQYTMPDGQGALKIQRVQ